MAKQRVIIDDYGTEHPEAYGRFVRFQIDDKGRMSADFAEWKDKAAVGVFKPLTVQTFSLQSSELLDKLFKTALAEIYPAVTNLPSNPFDGSIDVLEVQVMADK